MAPRNKTKKRSTKVKSKATKAKIKSKSKAKAKVKEYVPRPIPRPKLFWTNHPKLVGPHPCNCNCTYCHHVRNCIVNSYYDSHRDGDPDCRKLGMRVDTGPSGVMVNQVGASSIESIYSEWL